MIKIGIRGHDLPTYNDVDKMNYELDRFGFDGVQLVLKKSFDTKFDPSEFMNELKGLNPLMVGAYFNPVHPDGAIVEEGIKHFKDMTKFASKVGSLYVGSETGSLMGSPWGYVKENHSDDSLAKVVTIFKDLCREAQKNGVNVAIEGAYAHVVYSPKRLKETLDLIDEINLFVTVDIFNYLNLDNYKNHVDIFKECLELFKDRIVILHLKDFVINDGELIQVGLGQGLMDYKRIIPIVKKELNDANLIFEGVKPEDIESSLKYIRNLLR